VPDKRNWIDKVETFSLVLLLVSGAGISLGVFGSFLYWLICG